MNTKLVWIFLVPITAAILACSDKEVSTFPLEKVPVVQSINSGELSDSIPSELSGKTITKADTASIDAIDGKEMDKDLRWYAKEGSQLNISGWSFNKSSDTNKAYLELVSSDGRYYALLNIDIERPDVAEVYDLPSPKVGYNFKGVANVKPGSYRIAVLYLAGNRLVRWESPARLIIDIDN